MENHTDANTSSNAVNPLQPMIDAHRGQQVEVPLSQYKEALGALDPQVVSARSGVLFTRDGSTPNEGAFELTMLGRPLRVAWPSLDITYADMGETPGAKVSIIVFDLLLNGQLVPSTGKYLSYAQVPWGSHYLKAFQGRCIMRLAFMFKTAADFARACEKLGGMPVNEGDASFEFDFLEGVKVRLTVWEADDEFGPTAQFLFSDNAPFAFTAEDLAAVGDIILGSLKQYK